MAQESVDHHTVHDAGDEVDLHLADVGSGDSGCPYMRARETLRLAGVPLCRCLSAVSAHRVGDGVMYKSIGPSRAMENVRASSRDWTSWVLSRATTR